MHLQELVYKRWFKVLIVLIMFIPVKTEIPFDSRYTINVIAQVLKNPYIVRTTWLLPITKLLLGIAALSPFLFKKHSEKILLGYYACILIPVAVFQNMAQTDYGFTIVIGNSIVQLLVSAFVFHDLIHKCSTLCGAPDKDYFWMIPLMFLSFLMPYTIQNSIIVPSLKNVLINEAGVTYCMITPVVIGTMILYRDGIYKPTLHLISFLGFGFGILNMMTWFGFEYQNWWMGICHLPLLIISFMGMKLSR